MYFFIRYVPCLPEFAFVPAQIYSGGGRVLSVDLCRPSQRHMHATDHQCRRELPQAAIAAAVPDKPCCAAEETGPQAVAAAFREAHRVCLETMLRGLLPHLESIFCGLPFGAIPAKTCSDKNPLTCAAYLEF